MSASPGNSGPQSDQGSTSARPDLKIRITLEPLRFDQTRISCTTGRIAIAKKNAGQGFSDVLLSDDMGGVNWLLHHLGEPIPDEHRTIHLTGMRPNGPRKTFETAVFVDGHSKKKSARLKAEDEQVARATIVDLAATPSRYRNIAEAHNRFLDSTTSGIMDPAVQKRTIGLVDDHLGRIGSPLFSSRAYTIAHATAAAALYAYGPKDARIAQHLAAATSFGKEAECAYNLSTWWHVEPRRDIDAAMPDKAQQARLVEESITSIESALRENERLGKLYGRLLAVHGRGATEQPPRP